MTQGFEFRADDRLLVLAPHPDDEVLATGGLIQVARAARVPVRVLVATDGDNNPWPQRWLERRWRIGDDARRRWGARRRDEARKALARLGVADDAMHFLGWPDQGLTRRLLDDARASDVLAEEIAGFAPTVVALPALGDRHPDHSALRVLMEVALSRHGGACRRLEYLVHGAADRDAGFALSLDEDQRNAKRLALLAHATQLSLSRRRMQRLCERDERFVVHAGLSDTRKPTLEWRGTIPGPAGWRRWQTHDLLLVVGAGGHADRLRMPLRGEGVCTMCNQGAESATLLQVRVVPAQDRLEISIVSGEPLGFAWAKLERRGHRVLIYDAHGWFDLGA
jgi:LmbE family N-acetylglucosaminyl deacetylase